MSCDLLALEAGRLALEGRIDFTSALSLRQAGEQAIDAAADELCIDFAAVSACNTVALSLMLCWLRRANSKSCALKFLNLPAELAAIARLAELEALLGLDGAD